MYTADEVLHGIDLTGRTAVVTGGYSGVGLAITRALNRAGARVIVPARRPDVARRNLGATAETVEMDLGDLSSVDAFAASYLRRHRALDFERDLLSRARQCPQVRRKHYPDHASVCASTPWVASITSNAPSQAARLRDTS